MLFLLFCKFEATIIKFAGQKEQGLHQQGIYQKSNTKTSINKDEAIPPPPWEGKIKAHSSMNMDRSMDAKVDPHP